MRDITQQNQHHYKNFQQTKQAAKAKHQGMKANRDLLPQQQQ